jgi:hypothetical protein
VVLTYRYDRKAVSVHEPVPGKGAAWSFHQWE